LMVSGLRLTSSVHFTASSFPTQPGGEPMILGTACFSIYSLISDRKSASRSPNHSSANTLDNSVLPTPVGPTNRNEPIGRYLDFRPALLRRTAFEILSTAFSCPMTLADN